MLFRSYHSRNGGGDAIVTDGHLPIVDVNEVVADEADHPERLELALDATRIYSESRSVSEVTKTLWRQRPLQTVVGAALVLILLLFQAWDVISMLLDWNGLRSEVVGYSSDIAAVSDDTATRIVAGALIGVSLLIGCLQVIASASVFRGSNRARLWILTLSTISVIVSMTNYFTGDRDLATNMYALTTIAMQVAVLLALSSDSSRMFTRFSTAALRAERQDRGLED